MSYQRMWAPAVLLAAFVAVSCSSAADRAAVAAEPTVAAEADAAPAQPAATETAQAEEAKAEPAEKTEEPAKAETVEKAEEPAKTEATGTETKPAMSESDRISYAIGISMGKGLKQDELDINTDMLARAIRDEMTDGERLMTDDEVEKELRDLNTKVMAARRKKAEEQQKKDQELAESNKVEAEAFLKANAKLEGVVSLPDGLEYKVLTEGAGATPTAEDVVRVHYRGTLIDGTEFDSSYARNEPATFPVTGVIRGWTEALQLMKVGSKWKLWIPPDLAYGPRRRSDKIGPNQLLVFEVELLGIEPKEKPPEQPKTPDQPEKPEGDGGE